MYLNAAQRADRRPRLASVLAGAAPGPRVQDQLAVFRDRELGREVGSCLRCGKPIRSQQAFIREVGLIFHVRCRHLHPVLRAPQRCGLGAAHARGMPAGCSRRGARTPSPRRTQRGSAR